MFFRDVPTHDGVSACAVIVATEQGFLAVLAGNCGDFDSVEVAEAFFVVLLQFEHGFLSGNGLL